MLYNPIIEMNIQKVILVQQIENEIDSSFERCIYWLLLTLQPYHY